MWKCQTHLRFIPNTHDPSQRKSDPVTMPYSNKYRHTPGVNYSATRDVHTLRVTHLGCGDSCNACHWRRSILPSTAHLPHSDSLYLLREPGYHGSCYTTGSHKWEKIPSHTWRSENRHRFATVVDLFGRCPQPGLLVGVRTTTRGYRAYFENKMPNCDSGAICAN